MDYPDVVPLELGGKPGAVSGDGVFEQHAGFLVTFVVGLESSAEHPLIK
jgi:hypothetical protein